MRAKNITDIEKLNKMIREGWIVKSARICDGKIVFLLIKDE